MRTRGPGLLLSVGLLLPVARPAGTEPVRGAAAEPFGDFSFRGAELMKVFALLAEAGRARDDGP